VEVPTQLSFFSATKLRNNSLLLTAAQGWVALSDDDGQSFQMQRVGSRSIAGAFERPDGSVEIYGEFGIHAAKLAALKK
jgi:hypothetical protein